MLQRIQTIYLLIADVLIATLFFFRFADISSSKEIYSAGIQGIFLDGTHQPQLVLHNWLLLILWIVTPILIFVTIFLFKKRKLQLKFSFGSLFLAVCLEGIIFLEIWLGAQRMSGHFSLTPYFLLTVIAIVFIYLAIKAIKKDELLIRSIDRIR